MKYQEIRIDSTVDTNTRWVEQTHQWSEDSSWMLEGFPLGRVHILMGRNEDRWNGQWVAHVNDRTYRFDRDVSLDDIKRECLNIMISEFVGATASLVALLRNGVPDDLEPEPIPDQISDPRTVPQVARYDVLQVNYKGTGYNCGRDEWLDYSSLRDSREAEIAIAVVRTGGKTTAIDCPAAEYRIMRGQEVVLNRPSVEELLDQVM